MSLLRNELTTDIEWIAELDAENRKLRTDRDALLAACKRAADALESAERNFEREHRRAQKITEYSLELESQLAQQAKPVEVDFRLAKVCAFVTCADKDEIHCFADYGDSVRFANADQHRYIYSADDWHYHSATEDKDGN